MRAIMARNEVIGRILKNGWACLAVLSPDSGEIQVYRDGEFQPHRGTLADLPHAESSTDWYRGARDHLDFAAIGPAADQSTPSENETEPCLTTSY